MPMTIFLNNCGRGLHQTGIYSAPAPPATQHDAPPTSYDSPSSGSLVAAPQGSLHGQLQPELSVSLDDTQAMPNIDLESDTQEADLEDDGGRSPQDQDGVGAVKSGIQGEDVLMGDIARKKVKALRDLKVLRISAKLRQRLREGSVRRTTRSQATQQDPAGEEEQSTDGPSLQRICSAEGGQEISPSPSFLAPVLPREPNAATLGLSLNQEHQANSTPQDPSASHSPEPVSILSLSDILNPEYLTVIHPPPQSLVRLP